MDIYRYIYPCIVSISKLAPLKIENVPLYTHNEN